MRGQEASASFDHQLASLGLAIYEAELVKAFIQSETRVERLKTGKSASRKLLLLDQEILLLKEKQSQVLGMAGPRWRQAKPSL